MSRVPMLCLPPAGAGPSYFNRWASQAKGFDVVPLELPGREKLFASPALSSMAELLPGLVTQANRLVGRPDRLAVFGHSFGAVLGYELALALHQECDVTLFVSGVGGPGARPRQPIAHLPDDEFIPAVRRYAGFRHPAMDDPDLLELLMPALRADITLQESHRLTVAHPMPDMAVIALRGAEDNLVDARDLAGWRTVTVGPYRSAELPGGHMYLESPAALLALVADELTRRVAR